MLPARQFLRARWFLEKALLWSQVIGELLQVMLKTRKGKNNLNVEYLKKFIKGIEEIGKTNSNSYLEMAVSNVNDYTKYGEYELALDIALDNLYEGSVFLDQEIISFARQAYAKSITSQKELLLEMLTKK